MIVDDILYYAEAAFQDGPITQAVDAVTAEDVTAAARKYIDPRALTAVVVGQIEEVRAARHPRWPFALDDARALLRPSGGSR